MHQRILLCTVERHSGERQQLSIVSKHAMELRPSLSEVIAGECSSDLRGRPENEQLRHTVQRGNAARPTQLGVVISFELVLSDLWDNWCRRQQNRATAWSRV